MNDVGIINTRTGLFDDEILCEISTEWMDLKDTMHRMNQLELNDLNQTTDFVETTEPTRYKQITNHTFLISNTSTDQGYPKFR